MDLADHLRVIVANWWKILLVALAVGVGAYSWSRSQDQVFEANSLLSVAGGDVVDPNAGSNEDQLAFRASYFAEVGMTTTISQKAIDKEDLPFTAKEALDHYEIITTDTSGLILVRSWGDSPKQAERLAAGVASGLIDTVDGDQEAARNARATQIIARIETLEEAIKDIEVGSREWEAYDDGLAVNKAALIDIQTQDFFRITAITPSLADRTPVSPRPQRDALLGFLVAFVLAAEGAVVGRAFSDRFARANDAASITELTGLPVLTMIPRGRGPEVVEAFRTLRTNLMFLEGAGRPRTIAVVSPNPGSGKSFVSMHLAESAVAVDAQVVLIDADLRRPVLHTRLRSEREPGLSNALRGGDLASALHDIANMPSLKLMPSGSPVSDTVGVLGGRSFRHILDALDTAELVVVDTPPGTVYADALAVAAQCDATLMVLDTRSTRRRPTQNMIEALERTGATLIGAVVNSTQISRRDTYGYERG